jgi:hypothetical protein
MATLDEMKSRGRIIEDKYGIMSCSIKYETYSEILGINSSWGVMVNTRLYSLFSF